MMNKRLGVGLAIGILALAVQAEAQAVTATKAITPGTLEALSSLTEPRSGFLSWGLGEPPDDGMPATFSVKLVPVVGLTQRIEVFARWGNPPDDGAPPDLVLILIPPDPGMPTGRIEVVGSCSLPR